MTERHMGHHVPLAPVEWAMAASGSFVPIGGVPDMIRRTPRNERRKLDPVTFGVIGGALFSVCQEMDITLRNASLSPIINIGKDFSCALFTADAQLVAQACNCPGHIGSLHFAIMACLNRFPSTGMVDGDVFILNDPYQGGTHLTDITLVAPIFSGKDLIMFAANRAHHSDVGGSVPGSFPMSSEVFEEGIRFPPIPLVREGQIDQCILDVLLANVRTPREVAGDLDAQLAANAAGARGVARLIEKYGDDAVLDAVDDYMDHSENALKGSLRIPDGAYSAEDWMDGDGHSEKKARINVTVIVEDMKVFVDFTGTDPQATGPINCVFPVTVSMVVTSLLSLSDPGIMPNHGFYRPLYIRAPYGCLVNPKEPAPAVGFPDVANRIFDTIMQALTPVLPERVIAATSGTTCNVFFGGQNPQTDEPYVWYSINSQGGWGGRHGADGWHNVCFIEANGWDIPVETIEYRYPWRVIKYGIRGDSAGPGRWRGGEGNYLALTPVDHDAVLSINGDRATTPPYGLFGGKPGATAHCTIRRADGAVEQVAPTTLKADRITVRQGDVVIIQATSGGGYGNPLDRAVSMVVRDVGDGIVSIARARSEYGVIVDAGTLTADQDATQQLRARMAAQFELLTHGHGAVDRSGYELQTEEIVDHE